MGRCLKARAGDAGSIEINHDDTTGRRDECMAGSHPRGNTGLGAVDTSVGERRRRTDRVDQCRGENGVAIDCARQEPLPLFVAAERGYRQAAQHHTGVVGNRGGGAAYLL